jgi:hypothetical protein
MPRSTTQPAHDLWTSMREMRWSPAEKAAARRVFDLALKRELDETVQEAKARAAKVTTPSDLWDLEHWLTNRRNEIDSKYDYRYSVLPQVFAVLIHEGRVSLEELAGLDSEKLDFIQRFVRV